MRENALQTEARIDCGRTGRAKWPRGKASSWLLVFYFCSLRSISSLAWPSWGTARSLRLAIGKKIVLREKRRLPSPEVWAAPTSKVWRHSDRAWYSHFHSKRLRKKPLLTGWCESYRAAGGGTPGNSWWGCAARFFKSWPYFRPKTCHFPHLFSDKTSKIHTRFQTWPLGINYVIIT